jgi:hypothetical protein
MKTMLLLSLTVILCAGVLPGCAISAPVNVTIEKTSNGYRLLRAGEPYVVKGAGVNMEDFASLASRGGNSVRTWHVEDDVSKGREMLDLAQSLGLTVSLCLNIARERQGFDYDDPASVQEQFSRARQAVLNYRDHPALLTWIIGNELNYDYQNPRVYNAVNDIAEMIHELDPNHPATTALAGFSADMMSVVSARAPALDLISVQMYADLVNLPRYIKESEYTGPYFITEWGTVGHWEVAKTDWGAPIEKTSTEKAVNYLAGYRNVIEPYLNRGIGNYVFLWGQKQERTPTWYGLLTEAGETTEAVDVMSYIWNGRWPDNRAPVVLNVTLNNRAPTDSIRLAPGTRYTARAQVVDPEEDALAFRWSIKPESESESHGGDFEEEPADLNGLTVIGDNGSVTLRTPDEPGPYRLFFYAADPHNQAAHGNIPFYVTAPD